MARRVGYDVSHLRKHQEFFGYCVAVHGVSFTVIDVQTPWPNFAFPVIGGNSPNFDMLGIVLFLNRLVRADLLSPDSFVYVSFDA